MSYFLKREFDYNPGIRYKGGGGSTGEVSYPTHMEEIHQEWFNWTDTDVPVFTTSMYDVMTTALSTNPLESLSYDDPSSDVTEMKTEYDSLNSQVDALDPNTDWTSLVDNAVSKVDEAGVLEDIDLATLISNAQTEAGNDLQKAVEKALEMVDDVIVEKAVISFTRAREKERARMKTRYKAGMSNIGAERSSAYAIGLALLEIDFEREVGQYETEFSNQLYQQGIQFYARALAIEIDARMKAKTLDKQTRDKMLMQGWSQMLQYKQFTVEMKRQLTTVLTELKRIGFVMNSEYVTNTADLNWKHSSWDMNVYANGITVLGGLGGSQFVPEGPSKVGSAIGGAMQGVALASTTASALSEAGASAAAGAVGGPVGLAVGGLLGLGAALFS